MTAQDPSPSPTREFAESVAANLQYWLQRTHQLNEQQFKPLGPDWPNIVRAVQFGLALPALWVPTATLARQMYDFADLMGYWTEWSGMLERLVDRQGEGEEVPRLRCQLLDQLGQLRRQAWQITGALEAHQAAERLALDLGDEDELGHVRFSLSEDYRYTRDYAAAERCGQSALEIFARLNAPEAQVAAVLNTLGLIAHARGQYEAAEDRLRESIERYRGLNRPTDLARVLKNLGVTLEARRFAEEALACYSESQAILDQTASEFDRVLVGINIGTLHFNQGRLDEAEEAFRRANSGYLRRSGIKYYQAVVANNLGNVSLAQGRLAEAEARLRHSLALWQELSDDLMRANTLGTLGETLVRQGQTASALPVYDEALELLARYPDDAWGRHLLAKYEAQRRALDSGG